MTNFPWLGGCRLGSATWADGEFGTVPKGQSQQFCNSSLDAIAPAMVSSKVLPDEGARSHVHQRPLCWPGQYTGGGGWRHAVVRCWRAAGL